MRVGGVGEHVGGAAERCGVKLEGGVDALFAKARCGLLESASSARSSGWIGSRRPSNTECSATWIRTAVPRRSAPGRARPDQHGLGPVDRDDDGVRFSVPRIQRSKTPGTPSVCNPR